MARKDQAPQDAPDVASVPDDGAGAGAGAGAGGQGTTDVAEVIEGRIIEHGPNSRAVATSAAAGEAEIEGFILADHPAMVVLNEFFTARFAEGNQADVAVADIVAQILSAETLEDVLIMRKPLGLRDLIGIPLRYYGAKAHKSRLDGKTQWFLYLDIERLDTGERIGATTGAVTVLAQIMKIHMLGQVPCEFAAVNATTTPTEKGGMPYRLTFAPQTGRLHAPSPTSSS